MFEPIVIDDLLPKQHADKIESVLFSNTFPWMFSEDITYNSVSSRTPAFSHLFFDTKDGMTSPYYYMVEPIFYAALEKAQMGRMNCVQARSFFQLPLLNRREYNNKHIDNRFPHVVCLYYVNDTDGDTFFFNKDDVTGTVSPKKNRVVLFDGATYHSSSNPTINKRAVINFNLVR